MQRIWGEGDPFARQGRGWELIGGHAPPIRENLFVPGSWRYSQPLRLKKSPVPSDDITISTSDMG